MSNRYPNIELLERVARDAPFDFSLDSGPVHFILPLAPEHHIDQQIQEAEKQRKSSPFANINNLRALMSDAVYKFSIDISEPMPSLEIVQEGDLGSDAQQDMLELDGTKLRGDADSIPNRVESHLSNLHHVKDNIEALDKQPDLVKSAIDDLNKSDAKDFKGLFANVRDRAAREALRKALPASVASEARLDNIRPWIQVFESYLENPGKGLLPITNDIQKCDTYLKKVEMSLDEYKPYIDSFVGLDLYARLVEKGGEGRRHKAPVSLHNLKGLVDTDEPALRGILENIKTQSSRGIVVVPGWLKPGGLCESALDEWLNDTSHSHFAVVDTVGSPPEFALEDPGAWFDQVAASAGPKKSGRAGARTLTFFPPLTREIEEKTYTISPVFAGAALLSRAELGYNPAYPQIKLEMGVVDDITGSIGQTYTSRLLTSERVERLNGQGYNTISLQTYPENRKDYFIMEPGATLSLERSRERFYTESLVALLEDMLQTYLRWHMQGGITDPEMMQGNLRNALFSDLENQGFIRDLQLSVTGTDKMKVKVDFKLDQAIEKISIEVTNNTNVSD